MCRYLVYEMIVLGQRLVKVHGGKMVEKPGMREMMLGGQMRV